LGGEGKLSGKAIKDKKQKTAYYRWFKKVQAGTPGFVESIKKTDLRKYFFVKPIYSNPRIRAQKGGFVLTGFIEQNGDLGRNNAHKAVKIIIPQKHNNKVKLLAELDALSINKMTLFPDMENTALYLREKYQALTKEKKTLSRKGEI